MYPVRGVETPHGGAARSKSAPNWFEGGLQRWGIQITSDHDDDGVDRRGFLKCMAWAGTGLVWTVGGGVLSSRVFGQGPDRSGTGSFSFVQISDSHIGFAKEANKDVIGTLQATDRQDQRAARSGRTC